MPGPLLSVTISESPRRGYATGPLLIAGHGILEATLVVALMVGMAPVLQRDEVFVVTAIGGSAILLWMAYGMLRSLPDLSLTADRSEPAKRSLLFTGIFMSLANPYWTIWWVSIGLGYIMQSSSLGYGGVLSFFSGHILADLLWYTAVSTAVWKGKNFLSDRSYRALIGACAAFLIVFSCLFAYSGVMKALAQ
jgi:threonine/homoserine/homoserine lactone efflux protein